jgi:hypothetical protein
MIAEATLTGEKQDILWAKIGRVQNALAIGKLESYSVVKTQDNTDKLVFSSWGPMMRT